MTLFCIWCVYLRKIREKSSSCKNAFSWLGQKVNKNIDVYSYDADNCGVTQNTDPRRKVTFFYN